MTITEDVEIERKRRAVFADDRSKTPDQILAEHRRQAAWDARLTNGPEPMPVRQPDETDAAYQARVAAGRNPTRLVNETDAAYQARVSARLPDETEAQYRQRLASGPVIDPPEIVAEEARRDRFDAKDHTKAQMTKETKREAKFDKDYDKKHPELP